MSADDDATALRARDPFGFPPGVTFGFFVVVVIAEVVVFNRASHAGLGFGAMALRLIGLGVGAIVVYGVVGMEYRVRLTRTNPKVAAAMDALDRDRREAAAVKTAADERARNAYAQGALEPVAAGHGIVPLAGESFYWIRDDVRLIGDRDRRMFRDGVTQGVLSIGVLQVDEHRQEELDRGTLVLSDRRVVFVGAQQPRAFPFDGILLLTPRDDGFVLAVVDTPPFTFVTGRKEDGVVVQRLMNGDVGSHEQAPQP